MTQKRLLNDVLLVIATLFHQRNPLKGRTRLQKTVFLLKELYDVPFSLDFRPYFYGPYSEDLADLISILKAIKVLDEVPEKLAPDIIRYNYELTDKGKEYFKRFKRFADKKTLRILERLKESSSEINRMRTPDLILTAKLVMNEIH